MRNRRELGSRTIATIGVRTIPLAELPNGTKTGSSKVSGTAETIHLLGEPNPLKKLPRNPFSDKEANTHPPQPRTADQSTLLLRRLTETSSATPSDILTKGFTFPSELPYAKYVTHATAEFPIAVQQKVATTILETAVAAASQPINKVREAAEALDETATPDQEKLLNKYQQSRNPLGDPDSAEYNLRREVATRLVEQELMSHFATPKGTAPKHETQQRILHTATHLTSTIVEELNQQDIVDTIIYVKDVIDENNAAVRDLGESSVDISSKPTLDNVFRRHRPVTYTLGEFDRSRYYF